MKEEFLIEPEALLGLPTDNKGLGKGDYGEVHLVWILKPKVKERKSSNCSRSPGSNSKKTEQGDESEMLNLIELDAESRAQAEEMLRQRDDADQWELDRRVAAKKLTKKREDKTQQADLNQMLINEVVMMQ